MIHSRWSAMPPKSKRAKEEEHPLVGLKPLRKRPLATPGETEAAENITSLPVTTTCDGSVAASAEGCSTSTSGSSLEEKLKADLKAAQDRLEETCREHQSIVEQKDREIEERDRKILELEHRLYYAELVNRDQFYAYHHAPYFFSHAEGEEVGKEEKEECHAPPRLCSRRGR